MLLQTFLVDKIHFGELLLGSLTAVYNVSSKKCLFLSKRSVSYSQNLLLCQRRLQVFGQGEKKVSEIVSGDFCEFLPPLRRWVLSPSPNEMAIPPPPWIVFVSPTEHIARSGRGDPLQHPHVSPVSCTIWYNNLLLSSAAVC